MRERASLRQVARPAKARDELPEARKIEIAETLARFAEPLVVERLTQVSAVQFHASLEVPGVRGGSSEVVDVDPDVGVGVPADVFAVCEDPRRRGFR